MAMNIHQEARRKQMHMDKVFEARQRMAFSQDDEPKQVKLKVQFYVKVKKRCALLLTY